MTQTEFNFSFPPNPFTPDTHNWRVWEYLREHGEIDTRTIHQVLHVDCTRVNNCKEKLNLVGYDIPKARPVEGERGNYLYQVVRI